MTAYLQKAPCHNFMDIQCEVNNHNFIAVFMYYQSTWLFSNGRRSHLLCSARPGPRSCEVWLEGKNGLISGKNGPGLSAVAISSLVT